MQLLILILLGADLPHFALLQQPITLAQQPNTVPTLYNFTHALSQPPPHQLLLLLLLQHVSLLSTPHASTPHHRPQQAYTYWRYVCPCHVCRRRMT